MCYTQVTGFQFQLFPAFAHMYYMCYTHIRLSRANYNLMISIISSSLLGQLQSKAITDEKILEGNFMTMF
jgi:hypothetical protein